MNPTITCPHYSCNASCDRGCGRPSGRPRAFLRMAQDKLTLRRTVQVRLGCESLRVPGGTTIFTVSPRRYMNNEGKRRTPMSAPRDSRCRYKECYNCKHRFDSITGDKPEYQCGLAIDGTIRVFECGGYRYYLPATKAQRREQHEKLTEYQVS
jgi:hypothetical protein